MKGGTKELPDSKLFHPLGICSSFHPTPALLSTTDFVAKKTVSIYTIGHRWDRQSYKGMELYKKED